jgi:hypothetical protein
VVSKALLFISKWQAMKRKYSTSSIPGPPASKHVMGEPHASLVAVQALLLYGCCELLMPQTDLQLQQFPCVSPSTAQTTLMDENIVHDDTLH